MKKFVFGFLLGFTLSMGIASYAMPEIRSAVFSDIKLFVNGKKINMEVVSVITAENPDFITNYVQARALAEALGATLTWDGKARTINVETEKPDSASVPDISSFPGKYILMDSQPYHCKKYLKL